MSSYYFMGEAIVGFCYDNLDIACTYILTYCVT